MNHEVILSLCLAKPGAYPDCPFGPKPVCAKVEGKIFVQVYAGANHNQVTFKCDAMTGDRLRMQYPGAVVRGYHCPPVQQPYWNTVDLDAGIPEEELRFMIDHAYQVVVAKLPRRVQERLRQSSAGIPQSQPIE